MSLLTPERVPVKVYKWDDIGAPVLDKTAGCMMAIFKECLVTGYGTKDGAGWTMPFGDAEAEVKVLRPEVGPHTDFYLRLSADTGTELAAQVYLNMTDTSTGDLKLQCTGDFKYAKRNNFGKWLLVASSRGFWFFCQQRVSGDINKRGAYFFCGDTTRNSFGSRAVFLQHTGGSNNDGSYSNVLSNSNSSPTSYLFGRMMPPDYTTTSVNAISPANGISDITTEHHLLPIMLIDNKRLYLLPGIYTSLAGSVCDNFDVVTAVDSRGSFDTIAFGAAGNIDGNLLVRSSDWVY